MIRPSRSQQKAVSQAAVYLEERARTELYQKNYPPAYAQLMAVDKYQQFLQTRVDTKGMLATAFGAYGGSLRIELSIDFETFLPGLTVGVGGSGEVSVASTVILAIHHSMPQQLTQIVDPQPTGARLGSLSSASPTQTVAHPSTAATPPPNGLNRQLKWSTNCPISFMTLFGKTFNFKLEAQAGAYFAHEPPLPEDDASQAVISASELPLDLSIGVQAQTSYNYQRLYAIDPSPGWYALGTDAALRSDFLQAIKTNRIRQLKAEIIEWLKGFDKNIFPLSIKVLKSPPTQDLQTEFVAYQHAKFTEHQYGRPMGTLDKGAAFFKTVLKQSRGFISEVIPENFKSLFKVLESSYQKAIAEFQDTDELLQSLAELYRFLPDADTIKAIYHAPQVQSEREQMLSGIENLKKRTGAYYWQLKNLKDQSSSPLSQDLPITFKQYGQKLITTADKYNCFLKISSHQAEIGGALSANLSIAGSSHGASGIIKKSAYRYQTYTPADSPHSPALIYTQDSSISYRQVTVASGASIAGLEAQYSKGFIVNAIKYRAIGIYWLYPYGSQPTQVPIEMGSGISYGLSVGAADLIKCMNSIRQDRQKPRLIKRMARHLRLTEDRLGNFIEKLPALNLGAYPSIIIEASFRLSRSISIPVRQRGYTDKQTGQSGQLYRLGGLWDTGQTADFAQRLPTQSDRYLDSIRLRFRLADQRESEIGFKLGIGVIANPGIKLAKIERAGQHAVIDLFARYYPFIPADPTATTLPPIDHDRRVPPVAIFHQ